MLLELLRSYFRPYKIYNPGLCICCDSQTIFYSTNEWYRDFYICKKCQSIPRERALMYAIEKYYPNWRELTIHESSPAKRGTSLKLKKNVKKYTESQFDPNLGLGVVHNGVRNENLEKLTFKNNSFDLFITQDVFEHILDAKKAFKEIARVLKKGGAHIFTVPLVNKYKKSEDRVIKKGRILKYLKKAEYHGSPNNLEGSLVTKDWGYDIVDYIYKNSGLTSTILFIDNIKLGIRAEYIEVIVSKK